MLTRLEVKGFKNLLDLTVDFGPFTCIAGANGVGKSNVFDAIEFLSLLATETLVEAARKVRDITDGRIGDPRDLFWDGYHGDEHRMSLSAEMIVPSEVTDDFGASAEATTTFLRYEVSLGYTKASDQASVGRLTLLSERLSHITRGQAPKHLKFRHSKRRFRDKVVAPHARAVVMADFTWEAAARPDPVSANAAAARSSPPTRVPTPSSSTCTAMAAAVGGHSRVRRWVRAGRSSARS